jgi:2-polyprenyl-6-methoxyphenol hydroxylase-like FAD-dependent oxidoreductase
MNIFIAGGGPAGLYAAHLIARRRPTAKITLVEQNLADATFGFGVVFSDRALEVLRNDDPETYAALLPRMETLTDLTVVHRGDAIRIDGIGFAAIGRLTLLRVLQQRLAGVGVIPQFSTAMTHLPSLSDYDLIIAADGVNSRLRTAHADAFETTIEPLSNHFVWYGTERPFDTLTQTFLETPDGTFNAHHYRYAPDRSTFIVECDAATFARNGFAAMTEDDSRRRCETLFCATLGGHRLITNKSLWRRFPRLTNRAFQHRNLVLVGDALRTAHFSIGSGTRLALEDVIALVRALDDHGFDVARALPAYEAARKPIIDKLVAAANTSAAWYEDFPQHMQLSPWDFAWSYIQRSGRIDIERLRKLSPIFVAGYEARRSAEARATAT